MQSNCIKEASKACFNTCCVNPPSLPHPPLGPTTTSVDSRGEFISAIVSSIEPNTTFTNHESLPSLQESYSNLRNAYPNYSNTVLADDIRAREYTHLSNHVCLDYIGHGLFSYSQFQRPIPVTEIASSSTSPPPLTEDPSSAPFFDISYNSVNLNSYLKYGIQESEFQATMRTRIMRYMNMSEEDYTLVFTANQSSAFKLLADSYPFNSNQNLLTVYDYENEAVQAMIESATKQGARVKSAVFSWPNFRVNSSKLRDIIVVNKSKARNRGVFTIPLQSRMTGARYSYQWMNLARENGWHVLLDSCALGAKDMETIGLSLFQPDFLISSFFKVFGQNPSGFSCLFIKKSSISILGQSSTTMGIINITPLENPYKTAAIDQTSKSEQNKQEIDELNPPPKSSIAIEFRGLDHADKLGRILISCRVRCLTNWLVNALSSLRHPNSGNGIRLVKIYGPRIKLDRGPNIAFNVYDWEGEKVDPNLVQKLADRNNISLTCGFLKNIWFPEKLQQEKPLVLENIKMVNPDEKRKVKPDMGILVASISIGMLSNFEDVYRVWGFVARFLDADFKEKEQWRYTALNQTTVEV